MNTSTTTAATTETDRIEREIHIKAPRSRVWRALSNPEEFGAWFGVDLEGQSFAPGGHARGRLNFTIRGNDNVMLDILIERIEPESLMSFRWHPFAIDPAIDYSKEDRTLVTFTLNDAPGGTLLKVVESGFDRVPPSRRMEAFRMNSGGWEGQLKNIDRHAAAT